MGTQSKREYLDAIRNRYLGAGKKEKKVILDEFCSICGYNRKYAIRLLNRPVEVVKVMPKRRPGRPKKYHHPTILVVLKRLWTLLNLPCSKRLKAAIPLWLPYYENHYGTDLPDNIKRLLLSVSPATIDRLMAPLRSHYNKLGFATTKPGSILKRHIPVTTNQWNETCPGFLEADTVAHCGSSVAGMFVYTVNVVDIATGWTEQRAVWGRGQRGVIGAIHSIEETLPFPILGFDCDNGSEFLNWHLLKYFTHRKRPVKYTRSRPYYKNDNAHIEEKNWTIVRQYLGYNRFDEPQLADQLNDLYTSQWRLFMNFFVPSSKLVAKQRSGSKTIKQYDQPKTPYQRVQESDHVPKNTKQELRVLFETLNPFLLQEKLKEKVIMILKQSQTPARQQTPVASY
ncbi:MAG: transposase, partial [Candidatus Binatia bacterium]